MVVAIEELLTKDQICRELGLKRFQLDRFRTLGILSPPTKVVQADTRYYPARWARQDVERLRRALEMRKEGKGWDQIRMALCQPGALSKRQLEAIAGDAVK